MVTWTPARLRIYRSEQEVGAALAWERQHLENDDALFLLRLVYQLVELHSDSQKSLFRVPGEHSDFIA
jgi:hypothetical protein